MIYINVTTTCTTDSIILIQNILAIVVKGKHVVHVTMMEIEGLVSGVSHSNSAYTPANLCGTKNPNGHARISICREVVFIFEGTLCSLKITCSFLLTHHNNNDGGQLSTTQCTICMGNSLWYRNIAQTCAQ